MLSRNATKAAIFPKNCSLVAMASSCKLREAWEAIFQRKFPIEVQVAVLKRVPTMFLKSKQRIIREKLDLKP